MVAAPAVVTPVFVPDEPAALVEPDFLPAGAATRLVGRFSVGCRPGTIRLPLGGAPWLPNGSSGTDGGITGPRSSLTDFAKNAVFGLSGVAVALSMVPPTLASMWPCGNSKSLVP